MEFGTVIVTKDRDHCLDRTIKALLKSDLMQWPIVVLNNGSTLHDPRQIVIENGLKCEYLNVGFNPGIVGSRVLAHRAASFRNWTHYCFLQDDFELQTQQNWLADTLRFIEEFGIDYCRLTIREMALGDTEHWVKGQLRELSGCRRWNCSHVQIPKQERIGSTDFLLTDKHYGDWAHIMSMQTSTLLFGATPLQFDGPTVAELLFEGDALSAFHGAVRSEFDFAVKHWIAYALGMTSCTGVLSSQASWSGLFDHFEAGSAGDRRDLPESNDWRTRLANGWHADLADKT